MGTVKIGEAPPLVGAGADRVAADGLDEGAASEAKRVSFDDFFECARKPGANRRATYASGSTKRTKPPGGISSRKSSTD